MFITGLEFRIGTSTLILDHANQPITLGDLSAGMIVEAEGYRDAAGQISATRIKIEYHPGFTRLSGTVLAISPGQVTVAQPTFQVLTATVILDERYQLISPQQLAVGQNVTLWADSRGGGQSAALQIRRNASGNLTVIDPAADDNAVTPQNFQLGQNYPNPFNPETTIPLQILDGGTHQVEIRVYNMLGQEVNRVFEGMLSGGSYRFRWNGQDGNSQPVSSGIYLYRLRIDHQMVSSKRMILLR